MSATRRGFILFGILVVVVAIFCVGLPFFWLPKAGIGVGLPSTSLPAEPLTNPGLFGLPLLNSFTSLIVVDIIVLLIAFAVNRAVNMQAPNRFIPRGVTHGVELLVDFWYTQARNVLGEFTPRVLPLALTIFLFLIVANWSDLIPGFETVGLLTCAESGQAGYPVRDTGPLLLVNSGDLKGRAGTKVTDADTEACEKAHPSNVAPARPDATPKTPPTDAQVAAANPNLFQVVPFFRALATDLNLPLALAIIVFIAVQVWGIQALGGAYFYKFINIPALGNLAKNPMGAMDFVVGLVDIISELSRLISLSFRLLGNVFAGGVLLAVMTFLVAGVLPVAFYGLELFAGAIQAYVFAILTIMYASQAVFAHHAEEHEEEHEVHDAHAPAATPQAELG